MSDLRALVIDLLAIEDGITGHLTLDPSCRPERCPSMLALREGWDAVLEKLRGAVHDQGDGA